MLHKPAPVLLGELIDLLLASRYGYSVDPERMKAACFAWLAAHLLAYGTDLFKPNHHDCGHMADLLFLVDELPRGALR